ncbi:MAG: Protein of unknown function (DUF2796) [Marinobacter excellens HL-55]|uniref:DUF2796 domain-containing protein n=1 Tax=Marinobacter excellens HL-55 TaxID=1305731 RepID=A0A0P7ZC97_9GAMM|nr:MAG: Protein of unknown function (DUF2796) [Marinobacter excellens HL-55]
MPTLNAPIRTLSLVLASSLAAMPSLASDNPSAHQHGHADLQIAVDNERIDLLLLSPAYNLIGFEHKPRTDEQRQRVQAVESWSAETALINTPAGACTINSTALNASWGDSNDHKPHHDHKHAHDHEHGEDHASNSPHTDVEITQSLSCPGLSANTQLETTLMTQFPEMEYLNVQWVGPQGQGAVRLTPAQARFQLNR